MMIRSAFVALSLLLASFTGALAQCGTQAPANTYCGNNSGSQGLAGYKPVSGLVAPITVGTSPILSGISHGVLTNNAGVLGNTAAGVNGQLFTGNTGAEPSWSSTPVLGIPGTTLGRLGLAGSASGTVTLTPQAIAGTVTLTLPNASGTVAANATTPLALSATTGTLTCPTCVTSSGGGAITGTAPITVSAAGVVSIDAPYVSLTANNGGILYSGPTNLAILAGTATAGQMLRSGISSAPSWSTAVWPATTTINQLLYSGVANTVSGLATSNGGMLNASSAGVPSITPTPVLGVAGSVLGTLGLSGSTSGVVTLTPQTTAGTVTLTLPNTSGTIAAGATTPLALSATTGVLTCPTCVTSSGGGAISGTAPIAVSAAGVVSINAPYVTLTASNGGIVYSGATNLAILAGNATARLPLLSGASTTPQWGAYTLPVSVTSGGVACFTSTSVEASSALLTANALVLGGGAGVCPGPMASLGTTTTILHGNASGAPTFGQVVYADIASAAIASASNYFSGASSVLVPADQIYQAEVTITYGLTTTIDFNTLINGVVTLTGNITTQTLSNVKAGKAGTITFIQDGTGSRTSVWNSVFKFAGGVTPSLSTTASAVDVLSYSCRSATFCVAALSKDVR